jgi:ribonuclease Z
MDRQDPALIFVGTGEALDPELPNTSLLVRAAQTLLLDCGYAVPHALWRLTRDVDELDAVWISHVHADHVFGLPALLMWMRLGGRERPLTLLGGPGSAAALAQVLELGYPGSFAPHKCFPIHYVELRPGELGRLGPLELRVAASAHSVANHALRVEAPGMRSLVYSGDGAATEATRALCRGAAVLVHECFFASAAAAAAGKHGDLESCFELAREAGVETLALLHFAREAKAAIRERALALASEDFELLLPSPGEQLCLAREVPRCPTRKTPMA